MGVWRVTQRLGEAAAQYQEEVTRYHGAVAAQTRLPKKRRGWW